MTGPQDPQPPDPASGWEPVVPPPPPNYPPPDYPQPDYPQPDYPQPPAPDQSSDAPAQTPPRPPAPPRPDRDQRFANRPQPLWGGAIAATGIVLSIFGIILWSGGYVADHIGDDGFGGGSSHTWLGSLLSIVAVIAGYLLAASAKRGPLNTAGVTASAIAVPVAMIFLTFGPNGDGLPYNADATVLVSVGVWLTSYFLVPGARGHALYLGLSAFELWSYALEKIAPSSLSSDAVSPVFGGGGSGFGTSGLKSDLSQMAVASLALGAAYYAAVFVLDRRGKHGVAQAFAFAGFPAVAGGIGLAAYPAGQVGTGILLLVAGVALAYCGAISGRRFTTWIWAAASGIGVFVLIAKASPDNTTAAGITFVVVGVVFVLISTVLTSALNEREYPVG